LQGVTALCLAAGEGGLDTVQLLVSNGGDVDLCGKPDASARGANPFNLRGLSTPGVNSGALAFTPLQAACAGNHPGVVQYLCGKVGDLVGWLQC
jgi:ankyrin repeat protein